VYALNRTLAALTIALSLGFFLFAVAHFHALSYQERAAAMLAQVERNR
jgi:hypothetical protein